MRKAFCSRCTVLWRLNPPETPLYNFNITPGTLPVVLSLNEVHPAFSLPLPVLSTSRRLLTRPSVLQDVQRRIASAFGLLLDSERLEKKKREDVWRNADDRPAPIQATESCSNWTLALLGVLIKLSAVSCEWRETAAASCPALTPWIFI